VLQNLEAFYVLSKVSIANPKGSQTILFALAMPLGDLLYQKTNLSFTHRITLKRVPSLRCPNLRHSIKATTVTCVDVEEVANHLQHLKIWPVRVA